MFFKPKAKDIAQRNLEEAERNLLVHESQELYHRKMKEYYQESIKTLDARATGAALPIAKGFSNNVS